MKKIIILFCGLFSNFLLAQTEHFSCGTTIDAGTTIQTLSNLNNGIYSGSTDPDYLAQFEPISVYLHFWVINRDDGSNDTGINYDIIKQNLEKVNEYFSSMNICFISKGYDNFNSSDLYDNDVNYWDIRGKAITENKVLDNTINVYLTRRLTGGINGAAVAGENIVVMASPGLAMDRGHTLAHELAHTFNLMHPWGDDNDGSSTNEHVTRDTNSTYYNALSTGDMIHDTPAMISFFKEAQLFNTDIWGVISNHCEYIGSNTDNLGVPFEITRTDVGNIMGYTPTSCILGFTIGQGIRIREYIDAFPNSFSVRAVASNRPIDLYIRDTEEDFGEEPNTVGEIMWNSPDIWVRHQEDYIYENQNPEYHPTQPNYIHVRIRNRGCDTSTGNEKIKLYWSKAATAMNWDSHWNGDTFDNGPLVGNQIGTFELPQIASGEEIVLAFPWANMPNPNDYININEEPWHFCLLARIETDNDPMTTVETSDLSQNVRNNNNIAQKNVTMVDLNPNNSSLAVGGVVAVRNLKNQATKYSLEFSEINKDSNFPLIGEAEISIKLDNILMDAWIKGGKKSTGIKQRKNNNFIITADNAKLEGLYFAPEEVGTLDLKFNFLTKEASNKPNFKFQIVQRDGITSEVVGGENYEISKYYRTKFYAQIETSTSQTNGLLLKAKDIGEPAVYNWYDELGNLIYQGKDLTVTDEITQKYKLEIVALSDGYKDYEETEASGTNPNRINEIYPNPAVNHLTISYQLVSEESAYIAINSLYLSSNISNNYILDNTETQKVIDISNYPSGVYSVILVVGGNITEMKTIFKN